MKMNRILKNLSAGTMAALIAAASVATPVMAANSEYTEAGEQVIPVTATVASSYSVSVPATLSLADNGTGTYVGECTVAAKGTLPSNECVYIKPKEGLEIPLYGGGDTVTAELGQEKFTWGRTPAAQLSISKDSYTDHDFQVTADLSGKSGSFHGAVTYMFGKSFLVGEDEDYDSSHDLDKNTYTGAEVLDIIRSYAGKNSFSVKVSQEGSERVYVNARNGADMVADHIDTSTESSYVSAAEDPESEYYIDPAGIYILNRVTTDSDYDGSEDSVTYTADFAEKSYLI